MGVYDLSLLPRPSFPCLGGYVVGALWILVPSRVDTTYIPTQPRHSSRDTRTACNSQDLLGAVWSSGGDPRGGKAEYGDGWTAQLCNWPAGARDNQRLPENH